MTSIFEGQPSKTRPFPFKTGVIWFLGVYIYICVIVYICIFNTYFWVPHQMCRTCAAAWVFGRMLMFTTQQGGPLPVTNKGGYAAPLSRVITPGKAIYFRPFLRGPITPPNNWEGALRP